MRFGPEICGNPERASRLEWLETNGLGGFASSTIIGLNTRRYHGLLIAATRPPTGRMLLLSKLEETLNGVELSANRYPGVVHPEGFRYLLEFRLDPFPVFVYQVDGCTLEKRVFMLQGENTTVVEYRLLNGALSTLTIRPLIAFRDYHATTHENSAIRTAVENHDGVLTFAPYDGVPPMHLSHPGTTGPGMGWFRNFEFDRERERGLDCREDLFNPVLLTIPLEAGTPVRVTASAGDSSGAAGAAVSEPDLPEETPDLVRTLHRASGQFLTHRGALRSVIAGYHWFTDWGRDAMISLPGLTLVTGRHQAARQILDSFAEHIDQGMLPNRFPDGGEKPEYNTVDATLWFFEAIRAYTRYSGDYSWVRHVLYEKLKDIVAWHQRGTRYGIHLDSDGLLACGVPGVALTWMDVKIGDLVVTPRHGKPVEVQALWYHALRVLEDLARRFRDIRTRRECADLASAAARSFRARFWNTPAGCLFDVVRENEVDASIRPNQILAVSLSHPLLEGERARRVVDVVNRELRTPMGLRTLSPKDPQYRGRYEGDVAARDSAYHQGTVWPWLLGPFITAYVKVNGRSGAARAQAAAWLGAFYSHLNAECLGQISEIADGDSPHTPRGCVAQAWSVAEVLRATAEDL
jgi:predicted glycogen debranching enzyme